MTKEAKEEEQHFKKIINAFKSYKRDSDARLTRSSSNLKRMPLNTQKIINKNGFKANLEILQCCIDLNYGVLKDMIAEPDKMFDNSDARYNGDQGVEEDRPKTAPMDVEKLQSTLKQFVRDWSEVGKEEREMCYAPILQELDKLYPKRGDNNDSGLDSTGKSTPSRNEVKILCPGAGLGRLAFDIANNGFECEGNEFSLYMLLGSNYVLNKCKKKNSTEIYPWIHQYSNNWSIDDMTAAVKFPDINPEDLSEDAKLSMTAGDFLEVYSAEDYRSSKDVVVTSFFLDTARNVLDYIELIHQILKPGGHWINLGPLLYHYADVPGELSIEPPYDIVRKLILSSGFEYQREQTDIKAKYCQNPKSMLQYKYNCIFFTCIKKDS